MENKTSKYFKYAIGEIVLVVIGILIALQINTWNEQRKSNEVLRNYYSQILQDLKKDYSLTSTRIHSLETNIKIYKEFKENFQNQTTPKAALMGTDKLTSLPQFIDFNSNTIKTMSTTGDIKLIPEKLRNKLIDLMNRQDRIIGISQANNEMFLNEMIVASRLGYNHSNRLIEKDNFDDSYPLYSTLNIDDNYREIALIVNAAFKLRNVNQKLELAQIKYTKVSVNNIFTIINKELNSPYKDIESITDNTKSLAYLYQEGKTVDDIIAIVKQQDRENPVYNISEVEINNMGYHIMNAIKLNEEAIKVFKFNTEFYPKSWNTFDSYGECLLSIGDKENAIKAYRKSIELNPDNESGIEILSELELEKK